VEFAGMVNAGLKGLRHGEYRVTCCILSPSGRHTAPPCRAQIAPHTQAARYRDAATLIKNLHQISREFSANLLESPNTFFSRNC
jgi:hypothetical protein